MNGFPLFRLWGIRVSLHWSWLLVAVYEISTSNHRYSSYAWNAIEYLMLFVIVLMHEFGHALACRSVGGKADSIMLWPLGGVAFVNPPPRPGAFLWSIAAGPLVNVALIFVTIPLWLLHVRGDVGHLIFYVTVINATLLIFNMLPIYPLDGGQILQSLLWFIMGRGWSMAVSTVIGMIGAIGLGILALYLQSYFTGFMALFLGSQCWRGWKFGSMLRVREQAPRRIGCACPACGTSPLVGPFWVCSDCHTKFDTFATGGICPGCGKQFTITHCSECDTRSPFAAWQPPVLIPDAPVFIQT